MIIVDGIRKMKEEDTADFTGVHNFEDGSEPLVAFTDCGSVAIIGGVDDDGEPNIQVNFFSEDEADLIYYIDTGSKEQTYDVMLELVTVLQYADDIGEFHRKLLNPEHEFGPEKISG